MSIMSSIFMILGIVLVLLGILFFAIRTLTWKYTAQTQGRVIDMCINAFSYNVGGSGKVAFGIRTGSHSAGTRCPIYSYYVNEREYRKASNVAYNPGHVQKMMRKPVVVYYNPENPEQSSLGKMNAWAIIGIVFSGVGALFMVLGIVFIVVGI